MAAVHWCIVRFHKIALFASDVILSIVSEYARLFSSSRRQKIPGFFAKGVAPAIYVFTFELSVPSLPKILRTSSSGAFESAYFQILGKRLKYSDSEKLLLDRTFSVLACPISPYPISPYRIALAFG